MKIINESFYGEDFDDDAESVRQAMLAEASNLKKDTLTSIREGICNDFLAERLEFYDRNLKFK